MKKILALFVSTILTVTLAIGSTVSYVASEYIAADTYAGPVALTLSGEQSGTGSANVVNLGDAHWEPGYTAVMVLNVQNKGTNDASAIPFRVTFSYDTASTLPALANVIDVYWFLGTANVQRGELAGATSVGTLAQLLQGQGSAMLGEFPADADTYAISLVFQMREEAGNEYQNQTIPGFHVTIAPNP